MLELIKQPWHWAIAGTLIGLLIPILLLLGNIKLGVSSSLKHVCAICIPKNIPFFNYEWKKEIWSLFFVVGIVLGGFIASEFLANPNEIIVSQDTKNALQEFGITNYSELMPVQIFSIENILTLKGLVFFVIGGFLVGFGTRYAGGCTSGHSILGLSTLQLPSLIATCCFMIGGIVVINLIMPLIFKFL